MTRTSGTSATSVQREQQAAHDAVGAPAARRDGGELAAVVGAHPPAIPLRARCALAALGAVDEVAGDGVDEQREDEEHAGRRR